MMGRNMAPYLSVQKPLFMASVLPAKSTILYRLELAQISGEKASITEQLKRRDNV